MNKEFVTERLKLKDLYPKRAEALAKEYEIDIESLELVRKGIIAEKAEVDKDARAVTSYINTATKDRENEIIEPAGAILTSYRKNPVVPYGHDYRGLPVGKNIWVKKTEKGLLAKTVFLKHSFADDVFRLYSEDVAGTGPAMKGWSIGFIPLKWEDLTPKGKPPKEGELDARPRRIYKKWELVEYSAVMIPSNREALTEMVEKGLIKDDRLKKDIEQFIEIEEEGISSGWISLKDKLVTEEEILEEWIEKEVVTKPEETKDYIRLPVKGEEGKHKGHAIRWIAVSKKKGMQGIYCIDCKKIITYVFLKKAPFNWTMEKAKKWMEEHGKHVDDLIALWNENMPDEKDDYLEELFDAYLEAEEIELVDKEKPKDFFKAKPKEDYEYLLHHIEDEDGEEVIHHCYLYDHIANLFEQAHLLVKDGKTYLDGKLVKEGLFHIIKGLESTQETVWSDEEAKENKIKPKKMKAGMTLKEKSKEW